MFCRKKKSDMDDTSENGVTEEFSTSKVRAHLRREIIKMGRKWPNQVSYTFLLLPGLEKKWLKRIAEAGVSKWQSLDADEIIELLTMPHSIMNKLAITFLTVHSVVWGKQSTVIEIATELLREWDRRGCPRAEPVVIGRTLMLPESAEGRWCLTTCCKNDGTWYMVSRQKKRESEVCCEVAGSSDS